MIDFIKELALEAGKISRKRQQDLASLKFEYKGIRDLVTEADKEVEVFLREKIIDRFANHVIVGEEYGTSGKEEEHRWIIDPIDGTVSFMHGLPTYTISIAYQENKETVAGVVYAPALDQLFYATRGGGAFMTSNQLHVSKQENMIDSLWATGFACIRAGLEANNLQYLNKIIYHIRDIRRMGSAALDLAYTAAGKMDGFWEMCLNDYDVAAGILLVQEAGGIVTDFQGTERYPEHGLVAANPKLHKSMIQLIN